MNLTQIVLNQSDETGPHLGRPRDVTPTKTLLEHLKLALLLAPRVSAVCNVLYLIRLQTCHLPF